MDKKEYIERGALKDAFNTDLQCMQSWDVSLFQLLMIEIDEAPAADVISRGVFEQVKWERDMAMQQLEEHGIPFGAKADVVEVRHGYWKWETKIEPQAQNRLYCSICDNECLSKGNYYVKSKYCPHCGAKMDGERKEQT